MDFIVYSPRNLICRHNFSCVLFVNLRLILSLYYLINENLKMTTWESVCFILSHCWFMHYQAIFDIMFCFMNLYKLMLDYIFFIYFPLYLVGKTCILRYWNIEYSECNVWRIYSFLNLLLHDWKGVAYDNVLSFLTTSLILMGLLLSLRLFHSYDK